MSQISLTASMRSNLLSLQNTSKLMDQTQERLATGNKVNSAIDNPSSYYTAQSLNNRASDLSSLLDSMGQAISTIKAADEGIEAITSFVEQAKAIASSALDTTDGEDVASYMEQFNSIREQIDALAKDSGYKGVNLINGDSLTVTFNEGRTSKLEIAGQDATTTGLAINEAADWVKEEPVYTASDTATAVELGSKAEYTSDADHGTIAAGGYIEKDGSIFVNTGAEISDTTDLSTVTLTEVVKADDGKYYAKGDVTAGTETVLTISKETIEASVTEAMDAINTLRTMSSVLGNNYSIVETRQDFTENLINVLEEGADKLTLADMNEESANMLALQTRQQLAINSLSLASQAAQSVLQLF